MKATYDNGELKIGDEVYDITKETPSETKEYTLGYLGGVVDEVYKLENKTIRLVRTKEGGFITGMYEYRDEIFTIKNIKSNSIFKISKTEIYVDEVFDLEYIKGMAVVDEIASHILEIEQISYLNGIVKIFCHEHKYCIQWKMPLSAYELAIS